MKSSYRQRSIGNRKLSPETLMTSYGYDPFLSEGSVKPPVFLTSTFAFRSAGNVIGQPSTSVSASATGLPASTASIASFNSRRVGSFRTPLSRYWSSIRPR